jgi:hypothetical protein
MSEIKYLVKGEFVESKEAMEWMKDNEGVFVESSNNCIYVYKESYFRRYVFKDIYYYSSLPRSHFELSVTNWCSDKQWCPVQ